MKYTLEEAKNVIETEKDTLIGKPFYDEEGNVLTYVNDLIFVPYNENDQHRTTMEFLVVLNENNLNNKISLLKYDEKFNKKTTEFEVNVIGSIMFGSSIFSELFFFKSSL